MPQPLRLPIAQMTKNCNRLFARSPRSSPAPAHWPWLPVFNFIFSQPAPATTIILS